MATLHYAAVGKLYLPKPQISILEILLWNDFLKGFIIIAHVDNLLFSQEVFVILLCAGILINPGLLIILYLER